MKFLIVGLFGNDEKGIRRFQEYVDFVKKTIRVDLMLREATFITIDAPYKLDDYLYSQNAGKLDEHAGQVFDSLDMVFINGKSPKVAWHKELHNVFTLVRLCLLVEKPLLASGTAFHVYIFMIASNTTSLPNIINKDYRMKIEQCFNLRPSNQKSNEYLIDP